jgi:hypothetical protein
MRTKFDTELAEIRREDLDMIGELIAGLAVPYSLNRSLLGAAAGPWSQLHTEHGFGYASGEEYVASLLRHGKAMRQSLEEELEADA